MSDDLFDSSAGYDEEVGVQLATGLSPEEVHRATILYNLFNGLWGLCIVVGDPGTGKDLFGNYIAYRLKRYFPWKRIMRDERPRPLFGPYAGLFNEEVLRDELLRMRDLAKGTSTVKVDEILERAADDWVTKEGAVLLKNSVLYLTEFWRYCYNREPHNPMNKTMGGIHKQKRHIDCLILGTVQLPTELDKKTCLPWIDWRVTCTRSGVNKTRFTYFIEKVKYDRRLDILISTSKPFSISFDAGKPRSYIGDGKIVIACGHNRCPEWRQCNVRPTGAQNVAGIPGCSKRFAWYDPDTEEERIILDMIKAGINTYDEIIQTLEEDGDMSEWEVLSTLKDLKFKRTKRAVDYPCDFSTYNSKSAPNMATTVKVAE